MNPETIHARIDLFITPKGIKDVSKLARFIEEQFNFLAQVETEGCQIEGIYGIELTTNNYGYGQGITHKYETGGYY